MIEFCQKRTNQWQTDEPGHWFKQRHFIHEYYISIQLRDDFAIDIPYMQFGNSLVWIDTYFLQITLLPRNIKPANLCAGFAGKLFVIFSIADALWTSTIIIDS